MKVAYSPEKFLAMVLFIMLPFVGFWLGYKTVVSEPQERGTSKVETEQSLHQTTLEVTPQNNIQDVFVDTVSTTTENVESIKKEVQVPLTGPELLTLSRAYLAKDLVTGETLENKNENKQYPIASITKLITALVAVEQGGLAGTTTVPTDALVYTSKARLVEGEEVLLSDLLYLLLTESSNESAITLAHHFGYKWFVTEMNKKAQVIGMNDTVLVDPSGSGVGNVSTADDLVLLARYILEEHPAIFDLTASRSDGFMYGTSTYRDLGNFNYFAYDSTFVGGKTGQTKEAKETMIAIFHEGTGEKEYVVVYIVLGTEDSRRLIEYLRKKIYDVTARSL